jgi:hypothetical protein
MRLAGRKAHDIIELGEADGWRSPRFARLRPNRQGDPSDSRARSLTPFQAVRPAPAMCEELVEMIAGGTTASAWASIRFGPTPYTIASMPTLSVRNAAFQRACRVLDRYGTAARRALDVERHCSHVRYCWPLRRLAPGVTGFVLQVMHLFSSLACLVRSAAMSAAVFTARRASNGAVLYAALTLVLLAREANIPRSTIKILANAEKPRWYGILVESKQQKPAPTR